MTTVAARVLRAESVAAKVQELLTHEGSSSHAKFFLSMAPSWMCVYVTNHHYTKIKALAHSDDLKSRHFARAEERVHRAPARTAWQRTLEMEADSAPLNDDAGESGLPDSALRYAHVLGRLAAQRCHNSKHRKLEVVHNPRTLHDSPELWPEYHATLLSALRGISEVDGRRPIELNVGEYVAGFDSTQRHAVYQNFVRELMQWPNVELLITPVSNELARQELDVDLLSLL